MNLSHGVWAVKPPLMIGDSGEWVSESSGLATGTEGSVTYQIEDIDGVRVGEMRIHWDNPFVGSNEYDASVTPTAEAGGALRGYSVLHIGGDGNDANVTFMLLNGFCEVGEEGISCAMSSTGSLTAAGDHFAAIFEKRSGPSWHAVHGLSSDEYQQKFNELVGQGYRPVEVSGYATGDADRFAAIFEQRDGAPFAAFHGLTADQYQQKFNELVMQGYRLVAVRGYATA
ncbi:hypothetical protein [Streptomyces luteogriseus]|uniref:hypothetical protein n=1 Tax=Streptomyces luteogriseus TaxID=68233 RepID=UPI00367A46F7